MADRNRKIQVRLTEDELTILRWLGREEAEGMTDWICQVIWKRQKELQRTGGWSIEIMRRHLK